MVLHRRYYTTQALKKVVYSTHLARLRVPLPQCRVLRITCLWSHLLPKIAPVPAQ